MGFWVSSTYLKGRGQDVQVVGVHGRMPASRPKLGCNCCMAVRALASGGKCLLMNQRREGRRALLYERQP